MTGGYDSDMAAQFFWCLRHERVEEGDQACEADQRMGPYSSREEAANWREKKDARNEKWDREDREWEGEED